MRYATLALALSLPGCGGSSPAAPTGPPPTTLPRMSAVTASVSPSPLVAEPSANPGFMWALRFSVTITETAGLACNVNLVNWTLRNATTGVELNTLTWNPAEITARAGTNHVPARGSLTIPLAVVYTLSGGGRQGAGTVAAQVIDANGNTVNATATVSVVSRAVGPSLP